MDKLYRTKISKIFGAFVCLILILNCTIASEFNPNLNNHLSVDHLSGPVWDPNGSYDSITVHIESADHYPFSSGEIDRKDRPRGKKQKKRVRGRRPINEDPVDPTVYSTLPKEIGEFQNPENSFVPPPIDSNNFYVHPDRQLPDNPVVNQWVQFADQSEREKKGGRKERGKITELIWRPQKSLVRVNMEKIMNNFNHMCSTLLRTMEIGKVLCASGKPTGEES